MTTFADLGVAPKILTALTALGYEQPTPIQKESIPILLSGKDLLAQAQTGTGKTAAFALPILSQIDLSVKSPQAIILAPTRELAIQLAEAMQAYTKKMTGFHVLPIYGGQEYGGQLRALKRGVHVVVGTPGRVMDHIRKGTLQFEALKYVVLDEADEMLRMGFIEDVEWILEQIPNRPQTALFSATMPDPIRKVVNKYLNNPSEVHIKAQTRTIDTIQQFYMAVSHHNKLEALTRYLEIEEREGILIFTRTKTATVELAEKLEARGYATAAMNGDMKQSAREKVIGRIKKGTLDIVVATEVAARGLDVERISHVVNYDIPFDPESYIHRIGRTGRAGRSGKSLLFVTPRERRLLSDIERTIKMPITRINAPSVQQVNQKRDADFSNKVMAALQNRKLDNYRELVQDLQHKSESSAFDIAAALYSIAQPFKPMSGGDLTEASFDRDKPKKNSRKKGNGGKGNFEGKRKEFSGKKEKGKKDKTKKDKRKPSAKDKAKFAKKRIKKREKAKA